MNALLYALLSVPLLAAADWQPVIDGVKTILMTANTALLLWVLSKQRGNDRDTKTAKDAGLATAAAAGVSADVLPEVGPMQQAVNGSGLGARVTKVEGDVADLRQAFHDLKAVVTTAMANGPAQAAIAAVAALRGELKAGGMT